MPERDSGTGSPKRSGQSAIPSDLTRFIGRHAELVQLRQLLAAGTGPRLLTLVGLGGCGKTRSDRHRTPLYLQSEVHYHTRDCMRVAEAPLLRRYAAAHSAEQRRYHLLLEEMTAMRPMGGCFRAWRPWCTTTARGPRVLGSGWACQACWCRLGSISSISVSEQPNWALVRGRFPFGR
jgi:hypothetical protein